ncbi:MAG TPA: EAL domain-containing protein [Dehalococcoidia bacterium]|nr:EAL domain-containing protein [Dehalococcoidia bacterium]
MAAEAVPRCIVEVAVELLNVALASFVGNAGDHAVRYARRVGDETDTTPLRLPLDGSISGWVMRNARPYRSTDLSHDPLLHLRDAPQSCRVRPLLAVPVSSHEGHVLGVLHLCDRRDGRPFSDTDLDLASGLARLAALALERASLLAELRRGEALYRLLTECSNDVVFAVECSGSPSGAIQVLGGPVEELTGYPRSAFAADRELWQRLVHPDDLAQFAAAARRALAGATPSLRSYRLRHAATDEDRWIEDRLVARRDVRGEVTGLFGVARDVTARKLAEQRALHLASHDALTALLNRQRFLEELERELGRVRRRGTPGALLLLDLDNFKAVNDRLGQRAGDELLARLGQVLRARLRDGDIVARLGGDEFAILLPHTGEGDALALAARLQAALRREALPIGGQQVAVGASIGIAPFPALGTTAEALLVCADLAIHRAKARRDQVYLFRASPASAVAPAACGWERRLRMALDQDRFVLHAQPIENLRTGQRQYELLLRLIGRDGRLCEPDCFLPAAERAGLMGDIDRWVVLQAIYLLSPASPAPATLRICANLSSAALNDSALLALIEREIGRSGIDPRRLMLEITETAAIADLAGAQRFVRALKRLGCRFALDDFGVGFSSFYYLKHLPVDVIKIDGGFVRNLARDETDEQVVRGIATVARGLGKETIAEYVEDAETVAALRRLGIDHAQGFEIGRPVPLAEIR